MELSTKYDESEQAVKNERKHKNMEKMVEDIKFKLEVAQEAQENLEQIKTSNFKFYVLYHFFNIFMIYFILKRLFTIIIFC
jgi:hypothetical protein